MTELKFLLLRHGNTFGPDEKSFWVGAQTDLPLVERGKQQALAAGNWLRLSNYSIRRIICGPLKRTLETAEIVAKVISVPQLEIRIDERLREIDYGSWEGLTAEDIANRFGEAELAGWEDHGRWPASGGWAPTKQQLQHKICDLLREQTQSEDGERNLNEVILIVSSNGIFRIVAELCGIPPTGRKVSTGGISMVSISKSGQLTMNFWNRSPS